MLVVPGGSSPLNQQPLHNPTPHSKHVERHLGNGRCYMGLIDSNGELTDEVGCIVDVSSKTIYRGHVVKGVPHGYGQLKEIKGAILHIGFWENGIFVGAKTQEKKAEVKRDPYIPEKMSAGLNAVSRQEEDMFQRQVPLSEEDEEEYTGDERNGLRHGLGTLRWLGNIYTGQFKDGLFHGEGYFIGANHDEYKGNFEKGRMSGEGVYKQYNSPGQWDIYTGTFSNEKYFNGKIEYHNGCIFEGEAVDLTPHGEGTMIYPNHHEYRGNFKNGLKDGNGVYKQYIASDKWKILTGIFTNDDEFEGEIIGSDGSVYNGQAFKAAMHGKGTYIANGHKYVGTFSNNSIVKGKCYFKDGNVYEGEWQNWQRHGEGEFVFANNDIYKGNFVNNQFQGEGTFKTEFWTYTGSFLNNNLNGKGHCMYTNGFEYDGDWVNGCYQGHGVYENSYYTYDGEFIGGLKNGQGKYVEKFSDDVYEGKWLNGQQHGNFIVTTKNSVYEREYDHGIVLRQRELEKGKA